MNAGVVGLFSDRGGAIGGLIGASDLANCAGPAEEVMTSVWLVFNREGRKAMPAMTRTTNKAKPMRNEILFMK